MKNEADNLVYGAEKLVKQDLKDKIKPEQSEKINKAATELKDAITANNIDNIKTKIQDLKNILAEVSTEVYRAAGAAAATQYWPNRSYTRLADNCRIYRSRWRWNPTGSASPP